MSTACASCVGTTPVGLQIKGTFYRSYNDAVLNYNAQDEVSNAVDNMQRRVSHSFYHHLQDNPREAWEV